MISSSKLTCMPIILRSPIVRAMSQSSINGGSAYASLRNQVRKVEPENYLCGSLMPSRARDSFFVMRAFNAEVAAVRDATRGTVATARVRMAFWRDVIDCAFRSGGGSVSGAAGAHPLAAPLAAAIHAHSHTRRWLDRLVDARDADLDGLPHATVASLEAYAEATHSSLLYLSLESVGVRDVHADHAASHIGKAAGLANVIRGLPVHARLGQRYFPDDLLTKVSQECKTLTLLYFITNVLTNDPFPLPSFSFHHPHTHFRSMD